MSFKHLGVKIMSNRNLNEEVKAQPKRAAVTYGVFEHSSKLRRRQKTYQGAEKLL